MDNRRGTSEAIRYLLELGHRRIGFINGPLTKQALSALAIFTLTANWEEFLWPLIVSTSEASRTLPVGLQSFAEQYGTNIHWQMAGSVVAVAPLIIAFLLLQRQFVEGIAMTGLKG